MKRLYFILGALALVAATIATSPAAAAQENGNRDDYGKVVRGPYETNRFGDNWFIGAGGGINVFYNDGYKIAIAPSVDADLGKWFTPSVGMRVGYQGFQSNVWSETSSLLGSVLDSDKNMYEQKFGYMYFHGDFLWNISNALSGYKETRFWNLVPYAHAGFYRSYGLDNVDFSNNEFAMGAGLLHNLRLTDRLDLTIDMRATVVNGRVHMSDGVAILGSVTAGLAVDLGWPDFVRTATVLAAADIANAEKIAIIETAAAALELANAALAEQNEKLATTNMTLSNEVKKLKNQKPSNYDLSAFFEGMEPTVYFEIGKTVLSPMEMKHLDFIAKNLVEKAENETQIVITVMGTADSNTGTNQRNEYLSNARGQYIYDILTKNYGISPERLEVQSEVIQATENPAYDRAVRIAF
jgi:outer membrane protein OmpA-like peptidoglycan-associated protein